MAINPSRSERIALLLFLGSHLLAAFFSFGYHHPDEHYQILEFANFWAGITGGDASFLPWEYREQIRPWLQPLLHALPIRLLAPFGLHEPFLEAGFFRCLYALLNGWALYRLWQALRPRLGLSPESLILLATVWFFPFIHVRTSSENLSSIFLTFAFARWFRCEDRFKTGVLFGLAFLARFQIALGLAGLAGVLLFQQRGVRKSELSLLLGFLLMLGFGVVLDRVGYGTWVFTPYRYFKVNLVDGVAATYNPYPWYQYFIWMVELNPFLSLLGLMGVVNFIRRRPLDPMGAFVLSFFFVHLFIRNKEYRFLFPILNLAALMAVATFEQHRSWFVRKRILIPYGLFSLGGFMVSSLHGASLETLWSIHAVHQMGRADEVWLSNRDVVNETRSRYYQLENRTLHLFKNQEELRQGLRDLHPQHVLIDTPNQGAETDAWMNALESAGCTRSASALPAFLMNLRHSHPALSRLKIRVVFDCP